MVTEGTRNADFCSSASGADCPTVGNILFWDGIFLDPEAHGHHRVGVKILVIVHAKSFPKEQFWLFSNPIKICLLRLLAEGIFYTYPHSIVPTGLGYWLFIKLFIYATIGTQIVFKGMFIILLMGIVNVLL